MKPRLTLFYYVALLGIVLSYSPTSRAQQYKLKQTTSMMGMKSESTVYVKGMRKRTEGGGMMGMGANLVTIEQCDLQRTITLNEKKKLYFIQPFAKNNEVIDEDAKPAAKKDKPVTPTKTTQQGGVVTMYYSIVDTGERKKMYGFNARHVWTTNKIKPSPDACMKDSLYMKTDGWYIDLPEFNCPVSDGGSGVAGGYQKPECQDSFVTRRSGKGKLGFPLIEKRTIIMGGKSETSEFVTDLETLEFSTAKLDSMLFVVPPGYTEASSYDQLQDKMDMSQYTEQVKNYNKENNEVKTNVEGEKKAGAIRIGVYVPKGDALPGTALQQELVNTLSSGNIEAVPVASEEEAKSLNCDLVLNTDFTKVKPASKVGGILKAIKNTDPSAASSFTIEATLVLTTLADGSTRLTESVSGKYDGSLENASKKAMEDGGRKVLRGLK